MLRSHAWNAMHLSVKEKISVTQLECGLIFNKMINDYFDGITLEDLMHRNTELSEDEK